MDRQDEDGTPHFTYFDYQTQLSFIWDGSQDRIQVAHGGYGEPVIDTITVMMPPISLLPSTDWLSWFQSICDLYVVTRGAEYA